MYPRRNEESPSLVDDEVIDGERPLLSSLSGALVEDEGVVAARGRVGVEPLQQELEHRLRVVLAVRALQRHRDVTQRKDGVPGLMKTLNKVSILNFCFNRV